MRTEAFTTVLGPGRGAALLTLAAAGPITGAAQWMRVFAELRDRDALSSPAAAQHIDALAEYAVDHWARNRPNCGHAAKLGLPTMSDPGLRIAARRAVPTALKLRTKEPRRVEDVYLAVSQGAHYHWADLIVTTNSYAREPMTKLLTATASSRAQADGTKPADLMNVNKWEKLLTLALSRTDNSEQPARVTVSRAVLDRLNG